jgi:hypothetical protein
MPVYLIHGFRWPRGGVPSVRVYIVLEDLEDAAAEYIQEPTTTQVLLESFNDNHPDLMAHLPNLQFIEQYDPEDIGDAAVSQPYAYVASRAVTLPDKARPKGGLSERIDERRAESLRPSAEQLKALEQLRDLIAPGQEIGCWVIYNGDPDRDYPQVDKESPELESHIMADEPERAEPGVRNPLLDK